MTEPVPEPKKEEPKQDLLAEFKEQMQKEFAALKADTETKVKALSDENAQLKKDKEELQRALVRSATTEPPEDKPKEKTKEELYQEDVQNGAKRVLELLGCKVE